MACFSCIRQFLCQQWLTDISRPLRSLRTMAEVQIGWPHRTQVSALLKSLPALRCCRCSHGGRMLMHVRVSQSRSYPLFNVTDRQRVFLAPHVRLVITLSIQSQGRAAPVQEVMRTTDSIVFLPESPTGAPDGARIPAAEQQVMMHADTIYLQRYHSG